MKISKKEALEISREIFKQWNILLQTRDPKKVSMIYTENNMFLPTMSGNFEFGRDGDEKYFKHFLEKNPVGTIMQDDVRVSCDFIVHAGMYNFEIDSESNGREVVEARFTFVYNQDDEGEWKIVHHHSSVKPN